MSLVAMRSGVKLKSFKKLCSLGVAVAMLGQNLAFAFDPLALAQLSPEGQTLLQKAQSKAANRYQGFSLERKIKFVTRTEKRLSKVSKKLSRITEERFEKLQARFLKTAKVQERAENFSNSDLDLLAQDEQELFSDLMTVAESDTFKNKDGLAVQSQPLSLANTLVGVERALKELRAEKESLIQTGESILPPSKIAGIFFIAICVGIIIASSVLIAVIPGGVIFGSIMLAFGVAAIIAIVISVYVKPKAELI